METKYPIGGSCACKHIRYRMDAPPIIVHCCHCHSCQRETGTAFALNAVLESTNLTLLPLSSANHPSLTLTPSASGLGQQIARCPICKVALWSHYAEAGPLVAYVRVGTLEHPNAVGGSGVHIFAGEKQRWVVLDRDGEGEGRVPVFEGYYRREAVWGREGLERWEGLRGRLRDIGLGWRARREVEMGIEGRVAWCEEPSGDLWWRFDSLVQKG